MIEKGDTLIAGDSSGGPQFGSAPLQFITSNALFGSDSSGPLNAGAFSEGPILAPIGASQVSHVGASSTNATDALSMVVGSSYTRPMSETHSDASLTPVTPRHDPTAASHGSAAPLDQTPVGGFGGNVEEITVVAQAGPVNGFIAGDLGTGSYGDPGNYTGGGALTDANIVAESPGAFNGTIQQISTDESNRNFNAAKGAVANLTNQLMQETTSPSANGGNIQKGWSDLANAGLACANAARDAMGAAGLGAANSKAGASFALFQLGTAVANAINCVIDVTRSPNADESAALNSLGVSVEKAATIYTYTGGAAVPATGRTMAAYAAHNGQDAFTGGSLKTEASFYAHQSSVLLHS